MSGRQSFRKPIACVVIFFAIVRLARPPGRFRATWARLESGPDSFIARGTFVDTWSPLRQPPLFYVALIEVFSEPSLRIVFALF